MTKHRRGSHLEQYFTVVELPSLYCRSPAGHLSDFLIRLDSLCSPRHRGRVLPRKRRCPDLFTDLTARNIRAAARRSRSGGSLTPRNQNGEKKPRSQKQEKCEEQKTDETTSV
ncbi:hypothetical protein Baya_16550 [Bagarius yarrelli]|uniref:Uncharacterized protein n=1 Tax=Bagarius yarrelli TaxID=175774 RepID=A0A556VVV7_BAGYA|nr:hypothetical protein Baya_16550 [Bagarius yarrelli]